MKQLRTALIVGLLVALCVPIFAQSDAKVSEKSDIAVFGLGYYGYNIPSNVLATVDSKIQSVFVNLGRFNVIGQSLRFSSADINQFIELLRRTKEENTPLPEEVKFGEVQLTQSLLNQLYGSFVVVIPTIVSYTSEYNSKTERYETAIKTSVAFINAAEGTTFAWSEINTSGSSKETQTKSIEEAFIGIASQLEYEVRSIPIFTINTRILSASLGSVRMQLGKDMGIRVGDEYIVLQEKQVGDFVDEHEAGLVMVKDVQAKSSNAIILYGASAAQEGAQLRELPRSGVDTSISLGYLKYFGTRYDMDGEELSGAAVLNFKGTLTRGFYTVRPSFGITALLDLGLWFPVIMTAGSDFNFYFGRVTVTANASIAAGTNLLLMILNEAYNDSDDAWVSHFGVSASIGASYLLTRDIKVFAELSGTYMLGILDILSSGWADTPFGSYGGVGANLGICLKL